MNDPHSLVLPGNVIAVDIRCCQAGFGYLPSRRCCLRAPARHIRDFSLSPSEALVAVPRILIHCLSQGREIAYLASIAV